jgi:hypothetical protein
MIAAEAEEAEVEDAIDFHALLVCHYLLERAKITGETYPIPVPAGLNPDSAPGLNPYYIAGLIRAGEPNLFGVDLLAHGITDGREPYPGFVGEYMAKVASWGPAEFQKMQEDAWALVPKVCPCCGEEMAEVGE